MLFLSAAAGVAIIAAANAALRPSYDDDEKSDGEKSPSDGEKGE